MDPTIDPQTSASPLRSEPDQPSCNEEEETVEGTGAYFSSGHQPRGRTRSGSRVSIKEGTVPTQVHPFLNQQHLFIPGHEAVKGLSQIKP